MKTLIQQKITSFWEQLADIDHCRPLGLRLRTDHKRTDSDIIINECLIGVESIVRGIDETIVELMVKSSDQLNQLFQIETKEVECLESGIDLVQQKTRNGRNVVPMVGREEQVMDLRDL